MPESLQNFIWMFGVGMIAVLLSIVAFFVVRLIQGMDTFKIEVTTAISGLNSTMTTIKNDLGKDLSDLHARVKVIEEAGCIAHRNRRKDDQGE